MKKIKITILSILIILLFIPITFAINPIDIDLGISPDGPRVDVVSKGTAVLLCCIEVLEIIIPILCLSTKILVNKRKNNNKNTFINIGCYVFIAILIGILLAILGDLIYTNNKSIDIYDNTVGTRWYNGKIIYFYKLN